MVNFDAPPRNRVGYLYSILGEMVVLMNEPPAANAFYTRRRIYPKWRAETEAGFPNWEPIIPRNLFEYINTLDICGCTKSTITQVFLNCYLGF